MEQDDLAPSVHVMEGKWISSRDAHACQVADQLINTDQAAKSWICI